MSDLDFMRVGDIWRDKEDHGKLIKIISVNRSDGAIHPVRVKTKPTPIKGVEGWTASESFTCTAEYVMNLYKFVGSTDQ